MKLSIAALLVSSLLLAGCGGTPLLSRGTYNIGLCAPDSYIALEIKVTGSEVTTLAYSARPHSVEVVSDVPAFEYVRSEGDTLVYEQQTHGHVEQLRLKFNGKRVSGVFTYDGSVEGEVSGVKSSLSALAQDALDEFTACRQSEGH